MPAIPILKPKGVIKAFQMLGWEVACQRGSHIVLVKKNHIATLSSAKSSRGCAGDTAGVNRQSRPHGGRIFGSPRILEEVRDAADACGVGRDLGTGRPGKLADLQVVDVDPLADMDCLTRIEWVVPSGRIIRKAKNLT